MYLRIFSVQILEINWLNDIPDSNLMKHSYYKVPLSSFIVMLHMGMFLFSIWLVLLCFSISKYLGLM